jgi:glycosyltransferase involved in cell wall biosynthesis
MRILHVGWGFFPWRRGGLIHYAEDLMAAQVERGHDVAYFFSGRHYPRASDPRVRRWRRRGVAMHEVINGPIVSGLELGTRFPTLDLEEPHIEAAFAALLGSLRPDVVHFQELLCLPSSLIEVAGDAGVRTVMTLQDYLPLCATLRLFDADGRICTRLEVGEDCAVRNAEAPASRAPFVADTLHFEIERWRRRLHIGRVLNRLVFGRVSARVFDRGMRTVAREDPPQDQLQDAAAAAAAFQRRRDVNVARLGRADRLVAQSPRVAEMYTARGVDGRNMTVAPFTLAHIERLRPRTSPVSPSRLTFATLGGCASVSKGQDVVAGALSALRERGLEGRFSLRVLGGVHHDVRPALEAYDGVELTGLYERQELDSLLEDVDVGIMPSIWEEAFGYSGIEMLAKGIPLIANPLGGIVEYAREGETAWLNRSCSGEGLAELMSGLIADPGRVSDMSARVRASRDRLVTPMADHVSAIEELYQPLS